MFARVLIIALVLFVHTDSANLIGKGLFCRDPDTGKLHPVNATWSSTSFCGNYTCKLRKLNQTKTALAPIRQLNITNIIFKNDISTTESAKKSTDITDNNDKVPDFRPEIPISKMLKEYYNQESSDRYLTENEIKSIADALHKVKKSDIDALVEVYTLAQDIYHEMDKVPDKELMDESSGNLKETIPNINSKTFQHHVEKTRDTEGHSANSVSLTSKLKKEANFKNNKYSSYFNGPLTMKDFGKIPYYYPVSSFQRMSSYVHQPNQQGSPVKMNTERLKEKRIQYPTDFVETKDSQKLIKPSYLLPYPFSYVNKYNVSKYSNVYTSNPWVWDYYYRNRQSPYLKAYLTHIPTYSGAILVNPHLHDEEVQDIEQPVTKNTDNSIQVKSQEQWQTQPLSNQIINEIKANIDTSKRLKKAFPLRKKVKIEKVGKLIKMDELTRTRRDTITDINNSEPMNVLNVKQGMDTSKLEALEENVYEAFLERTTCEPQPVPGYFRYGNITEPFPNCCPQLIRNR